MFNQRRKMLRVSLRQLVNSKEENGETHDFFSDPIMTKRPEQLTVQEFVTLTNMVENTLCVRTQFVDVSQE